jgi:hypothetical protein
VSSETLRTLGFVRAGPALMSEMSGTSGPDIKLSGGSGAGRGVDKLDKSR